MSDFLDHALAYAAAGIPVFRCAFPQQYGPRWGCSCSKRDHCDSPGKHPIEKGWQSSSTTDTDRIREWWSEGARYNIGLITGTPSGIVVLDIDPQHGGDETLDELETRYGQLPPTWRFLTGGSGQHILFAHPGSGRYVPNKVGLGAGIDTRGDGGLIIAPPSRHISGRRYAISVDHHPEEVRLAPIPNWLCRLWGITGEPAARTGVLRHDWDLFAWTPIKEGERNNALVRLAGFLFSAAAGYPDLVGQLVLAWNQRWCDPPLDEAEVDTIITSIGNRHYGRSRHVP